MPTIPPANPYQQFSRWPRPPECRLRREKYLSGSVPDKCTRTSSTASERFSLMYRTRTPFEFHRPPTRQAPSPSYAG
jgi:hypothetical protein